MWQEIQINSRYWKCTEVSEKSGSLISASDESGGFRLRSEKRDWVRKFELLNVAWSVWLREKINWDFEFFFTVPHSASPNRLFSHCGGDDSDWKRSQPKTDTHGCLLKLYLEGEPRKKDSGRAATKRTDEVLSTEEEQNWTWHRNKIKYLDPRCEREQKFTDASREKQQWLATEKMNLPWAVEQNKRIQQEKTLTNAKRRKCEKEIESATLKDVSKKIWRWIQ
jgi:hypothetical protein